MQTLPVKLSIVFFGVFFVGLSKSDNVCGDVDIEASLDQKQTFQATHFPDNHGSSYLDCWYTVRAQNGTRIRFWFDSLGVDRFGGSFYIWCYNGEVGSIERFLIVNQEAQEGIMYHSGSNVMSLKLRVHGSYNYNGFRLQTLAVVSCGSRLEAYEEIQALTSPNYPFLHLPNLICHWTIIAADDYVVKITANQISDETCCDKVLIGDFKSNITVEGASFTSAGQQIEVEFTAVDSFERKTFRLSYSAEHVCGMRLLRAESSKSWFQAPAYPGDYSNTLFCFYTITAPEGTRIRFLINNFGTKTFRKNYFYIWFYDGISDLNNRFLILDEESQANKTFHSVSNAMLLKLRAYKPYQYTGFTISYAAVPSCGSKLTATEIPQRLSSPNYPSRDAANLICTWLISVPTGSVIQLVMKQLSEETCCVYVMINESPNQLFSRRLNASDVYYSDGNEIFVTFVADNSIERNGFELQFEKSPCGTDLTAITEYQSLSSPNYPDHHPPSIGYVIELTVKYLKEERCCNLLQVEVPSPRKVTVLNETNQIYISPGVLAAVKFFANKSKERKGFLIHYKAVHICGERTFQAEIDVENLINPPPYPGSYGNTMQCWYKINAPEETRIRFWIDDFGTKRFNIGNFFLKFYNNLQQLGSPFLTLGEIKQVGVMYHSISNLLGIRLQAYKPYVYTGFRMRYMAVDSCGEDLIAIWSKQNISAPFYPQQYRSNLTCTWRIYASQNHLVQLKAFYISNETCCERAKINVPSPTYLESGKTYTSPGTSLTIDFVSNSSMERNGIEIEYQAVLQQLTRSWITFFNLGSTQPSWCHVSFHIKLTWNEVTSSQIICVHWV